MLIFPFLANGQEKTETKPYKKKIIIREYFENGKLKEKGKKTLQLKVYALPDGSRPHGRRAYVKQGKWTEYYSNGNKKRLVIYDKGEILKVVKEWNVDGKLNKPPHDKI